MSSIIFKNKKRYNYQINRATNSRLFLIIFAFIIIFVIIALRLIDIAVISENYYYTPYSNENSKERGRILDRNGNILSINLKTLSLYVNPKLIIDSKEAFEKLSKVFPSINKKLLLKKLSNKSSSFIWIKRNLTPKEYNDVHVLGIAGLYFHRSTKRVYPKEEILSHIIGYTNIDNKGIAGIEKYYDNYLLNNQKDLQLSIDTNIQFIMYNEIEKQIKKFSAKAGAGIMMDINNGEIISLVNLPSYKANEIHKSNNKQLFNRSSLGVYEFGSTLKTITMAIALDNDIININSKYPIPRRMKLDRFVIRDHHYYSKILDVNEIFQYSSNIGIAKIILDTGVDLQKFYLKKLGFFKPLKLEIPEKSSSIMPQYWNETSSISMSYGYGMATTMIHITQAIAALINGGTLNYATLIKGNKLVSQKNIISAKTSYRIRKLLENAVLYGTGKKAYSKIVDIGGKTGTAEKIINNKYDDNKLISSFVGAFPIHKPKYIVFVFLDEPKKGLKSSFGQATGGWVAAPVVKNIIERSIYFLDIKTNKK